MKKLFFVAAIFFAFVSTTSAQEGSNERMFEKFKLDLSLGYGYFPGALLKSALLFAIEPKFSVIDQLAIGGKFEAGLQYKQITTTDEYGYSDKNERIKLNLGFNLCADY